MMLLCMLNWGLWALISETLEIENVMLGVSNESVECIIKLILQLKHHVSSTCNVIKHYNIQYWDTPTLIWYL